MKATWRVNAGWRDVMTKLLAIVFFGFAFLLLALAGSGDVRAQYCGCGNPPDPQYDTAGYVAWCSCMGGTYNYQTTECMGARRDCAGPPQTDTWGAIAYNTRTRALGWSYNFSSRRAAESYALRQCRGSCRIATYFKNACGAIAIGRGGGWAANWGETPAAAERRALAGCRQRDWECRVHRWVCSRN